MERPLDIAQDGELFPREELLDAVAGADWRDLPVRLVAWLAVAAGAGLALAGFPEQFDLLKGPTSFAASGDGVAAHPLHLLAHAIGRAGVGIEAAFFGLSALGVGAAFLALGAALRAVGGIRGSPGGRADGGLATGIQRHNSRPIGDSPSPVSTPTWRGQLVNTQLQLGLTRFLWGRRF